MRRFRRLMQVLIAAALVSIQLVPAQNAPTEKTDVVVVGADIPGQHLTSPAAATPHSRPAGCACATPISCLERSLDSL